MQRPHLGVGEPMASAAKNTALTLLTAGLVLGLAGSFLPAGENWVQEGSTRTTEVFTLFTYTLRVTSDDTVVRETGPLGWNHERMDGDAGTGAMSAAGIVATASLLVAIVGTILSFPYRTTRAGGAIAVFGAVGLAAATTLAVTGMRERTAEVLGDADAVDPRLGVFLLGAGFLLVLVGGVVVASLRRPVGPGTGPRWEEYPGFVGAQGIARAGPVRSLRCPDCGTTARAPMGVVPTCASCGFHRRDDPAAPAPDAPDVAWV